MRNEVLHSIHGYEIPCRSHLTGSQRVVILCHGFGSSKSSPTTTALQEELARNKVDSLCFDWPAHGECPADGSFLRVRCCFDDLATVEETLHARQPEGKIGYFASSFGAYLTVLYLSTRPHLGDRAFLRSAAVDMSGIFQGWLDTPLGTEMAANGFVMLGAGEGYARDMKITQGLVDDLSEYDVFRLYRPNAAKIAMIHGEADVVASPQKAHDFARLAGADFSLLPGAEHRLMGLGEQDLVLEKAIEFFLA